MKTIYPFSLGLVVFVIGLCGYVFGFWFIMAGYPFGVLMFYGGLVAMPIYVVLALIAPWGFAIKNRVLRRNRRLSTLMTPLVMAFFWLFITLMSG